MNTAVLILTDTGKAALVGANEEQARRAAGDALPKRYSFIGIDTPKAMESMAWAMGQMGKEWEQCRGESRTSSPSPATRTGSNAG